MRWSSEIGIVVSSKYICILETFGVSRRIVHTPASDWHLAYFAPVIDASYFDNLCDIKDAFFIFI